MYIECYITQLSETPHALIFRMIVDEICPDEYAGNRRCRVDPLVEGATYI
jgi:hypothetical protein